MTDDWDDDDEYPDVDDPFEEADGWYQCPACGQPLVDALDFCPFCEQYIIPVTMTRSSLKPMWWIFLGMLGIVATLLVVSGAVRFLF